MLVRNFINIFLHFIIPALMMLMVNGNELINDKDVGTTFKLLDEGEEKIQLLEDVRNITLVLGNTGAGKSTIVQWLAGDNTKLIAKEVREGSGEYLIEDGNVRIGSSTASKTLFPELVLDNKTGMAYYDCPGFSSTRSTSEDIASNFFNKKVADHAILVKVLLVTGYPSVRKGVDRMDFTKLLRHVTQMIKNIENFENSIALAVTKVDNSYIKSGKFFKIVPDEIVIRNIADYLESVIADLEEKIIEFGHQESEKEFCLNAIKLIKILLLQNDDKFVRIGIFRRPDVPGPLEESEVLEEGKENLKIILEQLQFANKLGDDFGYSVSEKSMNEINNLVNTLNKGVIKSTVEFEGKLLEYYRMMFNTNIRKKIHSFLNVNAVVTNKSEAMEYKSKFTKSIHTISEFVVENVKEHLDIHEMGLSLQNISQSLGLRELAEKQVKQIFVYAKYFAFFQLLSKVKLQTADVSQYFINLENNFGHLIEEIIEEINSVAKCITNSLSYNINQAVKFLISFYENQSDNVKVENTISSLYENILKISELNSKISNVTSAQQLSMIFTREPTIKNLPLMKAWTISVFHLGYYMEYLAALTNSNINTKTVMLDSWTVPFIQGKNYFHNKINWYKFLKDLYNVLSQYDVQKSKSLYNVANIDQWGSLQAQQGIIIREHNFQRFLQKMEKYKIPNIEAIKQIEINEKILRELNDVLNEVFVSKSDYSCVNGELYIYGYIIMLKEYTNDTPSFVHLCADTLRSVIVFAKNRIFIDDDISAIGRELELTIAAPSWYVIGKRTINLNGHDGPSIYPLKASNGVRHGSRGEDGIPGEPGGPGGHFFGIADKIVAGQNLHVFATGGKGGMGQDGGDGAIGWNGQSAQWPYSHIRHSEVVDEKKMIALFYNRVRKYTRFYGLHGGDGGSGGTGGARGSGGLEGNAKIISNQVGDRPLLSFSRGQVGDEGKGGSGAVGGYPGKDYIECGCYEVYIFAIFIPDSLCSCRNENREAEATASRGKNGKKGFDGLNFKDKKRPLRPNNYGQNEGKITARFKEFLSIGSVSRFVTHSMVKPIENTNINQLNPSTDENKQVTFESQEKLIFDKKDRTCSGISNISHSVVEVTQEYLLPE